VIADFPPVVDGTPSGPADLTYSPEAVEAMITAVHQEDPRENLEVLSSPSAILIDGVRVR
jgi:hypothetical protein